MSDHLWTVIGAIVAIIALPFAVLPFLPRPKRPRLIPRFDEPWGHSDAKPPRDTVTVYNGGDIAAMRVSIDPIELDESRTLTNGGRELFVDAGQTERLVLSLQNGQHGVLTFIRQPADIPSLIWERSVTKALEEGHVPDKRSTQVYINFSDTNGRRYRGIWRFEDDAVTHRVRLVFVDQFKV